MAGLQGAAKALAALALSLAGGGAAAAELELASPGGGLKVTVSDAGGQPRYTITHKGRPLIAPSPLGLDLDKGGALSEGLAITGSSRASVDTSYALIVGKTSKARDHYNELTVELGEPAPKARRLTLIVRAYDDGVALRYRLPDQPSLAGVAIRGELTRFDFPADYACWGLNLGKYGTSHEGEYDPVRASKIRDHNLYESPLLCDTGHGSSFALAEADLKNYAGLYLRGRGDGGLGVAVQLSPRLDDRTVAVRTRMGTDTLSSWRVVMVADSQGGLIENNLMTSLNPPTAIADTSWIKPGKTAWDWWNGTTVSGVDKPGMNDATMKKFIDFAHQAKLDYMMIDDGWYVGGGAAPAVLPGTDVTRSIPEIDMPGLVAYAAERGVGLWVWAHWKALDDQMDEALALYEKWGIKGIKVDFMDRDDQQIVDYYHRLLTKAAEHRLMVDLHGAYHPTGLVRTYPHYLTQEGVLGAEYNKWSARITATHNVTLPFTRMLVGPMDYTPGGFRNVAPKDFQSRFVLPTVQTTRGQALAMYVVYESGLVSVADTPDAYKDQPELAFISAVPAAWDETRVLSGRVGEHIVIARRKGRDWYVGAMTNEAGRSVKVPLDFLDGPYVAEIHQDGAAPTAVTISRRSVGPKTSLTLALAPSGGAAVRLTPEIAQ